MRIVADLGRCEGHGMCEAMAHEFFELDDAAPLGDAVVRVLDETPGEDDRALVDSAVRACPVSALRLQD